MFWLIFLTAVHAQCPDYEPTKKLFWGDLHVHTVHSLDASLQGTLTTHQQAYDFAKGKEFDFKENGITGQLTRPLDFVAITDHAEFLGETEICTNSSLQGYSSPTCRLYRNHPKTAFILLNSKLSQQPKGSPPEIDRLRLCNHKGVDCSHAAEQVWKQQNQLAEKNNSECSFTTFPAYEWSSSPKTNNLHRNVIFGNEHTPTRATSYFDSPTAPQLWDSLDQTCTDACEYITIPHNSNLSAGKMFLPYQKEDHDLINYAHLRAEHEPLVEIFQHKGSSECYPTQSDEFCSFEYLPFNNLIADRYDGFLTNPPSEQDFLRSVLKQGLIYEANGLPNPHKFGFVASTDTHLGAAGMVNEEEFIGHGGAGKASSNSGSLADSPYFNPGGLTAVWAEENSRGAIFSAFQQREVYGTSGPRISLRFFATREKLQGTCGSKEWLEQAYKKGVPMGGELEKHDDTHFYILVSQDPLSQPLERVQLIKAWLEDGTTKEEIDSLILSPAQTTHCLRWQDPSPPTNTAFYYARVLEKPSPRWSKKACQTNPCPDEIPEMIQERAWSSPIWIEQN